MFSDANKISAARALLALRGAASEFAPGEVWLVGAGPGDPGLLTLDALSGLVQADVIVHDALIDPRVLALVRSDAKLQYAGKRGGQPSTAQDDISAQLVHLARQGLRVLRLKGGDPFVFGRGGEELLALAAAGISFRVIPGVTAGLGALGNAWIPATMRGVNQAIILTTGHGADDGTVDWCALARTGQPIVIYMGLKNLESISLALLRGGLPESTPAAVIAAATMTNEKVLVSTLGRLALDAQSAHFEGPTLVVVGNIVRTRQAILDAILSGAAEGASPVDDRITSLAAPPCAG